MSENKNKILVVEDNELNSKLFHDILGAMDCEAVVVNHPSQFEDSLRIFTPDLILMDINLPERSGKELIQDLKSNEKYKDIPVIAVTAMALEQDKQTIIDAGCDGYITKPIDVMNFMKVIKDFLEK